MTSASVVYRGLPERFVAPKSGLPSRCRGGGKMICEVEIFWAFALVRRTSKKLCGRRIMFALSCRFFYFVEFNLCCMRSVEGGRSYTSPLSARLEPQNAEVRQKLAEAGQSQEV